MPEENFNHEVDDVAMPVLLRFARKSYGAAMREALSAAGYNDVPGNGMYVIGGLARAARPAEDTIQQLGLTPEKQQALLDALLQRGYLAAANGSFELTERGKGAAAAARSGLEAIDAELTEEVGADSVRQAKTVLAVLIDIHDRRHGLPRGKR